MVPPPFLPGLYYVNGVGVAVAIYGTKFGNKGSLVTGPYSMDPADTWLLVAAGATITMPAVPFSGIPYRLLVRSGHPSSNPIVVTSGSALYLIDVPNPVNIYDAATSVVINVDELNPAWVWTGTAMVLAE